MLIPCLALALTLAATSAGTNAETEKDLRTPQNGAVFTDTWQAAAIGYGASATGGGDAPPVTVTTASQLASAVSGSTPKVIYVSGTLHLTSDVRVGSNTTIVGLANARITGRQLDLVNGVDNIIIRNLTFDSTGYLDAIRLKYGATNVWIDHCTFEGAGDGAIDITQASDFVTVSWCKFLNISKVSLVGGEDDTTTDAGKFHITYHHNWFGTGSLERMPSVRYGRVHVFNNYYTYGTLTQGSGINFRVGSEVRIENNYFDGVHTPWASTQSDPLPAGFEQGKSYRSGNLVPGCTNVRNDYPNYTNLFTPPYPYTLDSAEIVKASVMAGAGAGQTAQLWLEAEDATLQSPFAAFSDTSASGDQYIESTQSSTRTVPTSGHVSYTNTLSGTAAVWLRIYCPSGSADSLWVKYGNGSFANFYNTTGVYGSWIWVQWGQVPAGGTLTLAYREAATRLDRVLFTNDLSFTPSEEGALNEAPAHEDLLQELVGFGRRTTGGQGGSLYTVTSLADSGPGTLRDALTGSATPLWIRFDVSGTIHLSSDIVVHSNKTIDGRGADVTISGHGIFLQNGASNLIVNNIKLANISGDALRLYNGSSRMWVHHCDISNAGDGAFDATENADEVTVSYTHIFNQDKVMLIGAGSDTGNGTGLHWTAHHNWYQNVTQRLPMLRMGKAHSYNNLFNWVSGTAIVSTIAPAQFFSENDILEPLSNVSHKLILVQNGGASRFQGAWQKPYPGGTLNITNTGTVFDPHAEYAYTPDEANSDLEAHIEQNAGWRNVPWPAGE